MTTICFSVIIAEVRALTAVRRATLRWRIISTAPSAAISIAAPSSTKAEPPPSSSGVNWQPESP